MAQIVLPPYAKTKERAAIAYNGLRIAYIIG
jgi:hypothetical protein